MLSGRPLRRVSIRPLGYLGRFYLFSGKKLQAKHSSELEEFDRSQILCEEVCRVFFSVNEEHFSEFSTYDLPDVMVTNVDVLGAFFGNWV